MGERRPTDPADRRAADDRIPPGWEPTPARTPGGNLRALIEATDGGLDRAEYVELARREIPGASGSMAERQLDRVLGEEEVTFPEADDDVAALADRIETALKSRSVAQTRVFVRAGRRQRRVTVHLTSEAAMGDLNAVWEILGDGEGVDWQRERRRWRVCPDLFGGLGGEDG